MRTCIGCRRRAGRSELVRIARGADGYVRVDRSKTASGRGAWVCANIGCLEQAIRKRRIGFALRVPGETAGLDELKEEFVWPR